MNRESHVLYTQLLEIAREAVRRLDAHPVAGRLIDGTLRREWYVAYLTQVVHQIRRSSPVLARAGVRLAELERYPRLAQLLCVKAGEEHGHDLWALEDLEALGVTPDIVERVRPSSAVIAYCAWAEHIAEAAPVAVLGLAFVLEWFGAARAGRAAENLVAKSNIDGISTAVTFLRAHGDADVSHIQVLADALCEVTDPDDDDAILLSAQVTATLYRGIFDTLCSHTR